MSVKHFRRAEPLAPGARVALIAPAGPLQKPEELPRAEENARAFGWQPIVTPHATDRIGYLAGRDRDRLYDINHALRDPKIDALWCLRGGYGIRVSGGQEHFLRAGFGCGPWVRLDERRRPAFPRLLARLAWFLDRGVDELLDGALAEEPACPAFGIQDVGTAPDAELRCFRPGKPDSVPDAELLEIGRASCRERV